MLIIYSIRYDYANLKILYPLQNQINNNKRAYIAVAYLKSCFEYLGPI